MREDDLYRMICLCFRTNQSTIVYSKCTCTMLDNNFHNAAVKTSPHAPYAHSIWLIKILARTQITPGASPQRTKTPHHQDTDRTNKYARPNRIRARIATQQPRQLRRLQTNFFRHLRRSRTRVIMRNFGERALAQARSLFDNMLSAVGVGVVAVCRCVRDDDVDDGAVIIFEERRCRTVRSVLMTTTTTTTPPSNPNVTKLHLNCFLHRAQCCDGVGEHTCASVGALAFAPPAHFREMTTTTTTTM